MASREDICNDALGLLGMDPIADIDDTDDANAVKCKQFFDLTRDSLLRRHAWAFAVTRVELAQLEDGPAFGYTYAYQLPSDCLRLLAAAEEGEDLDSATLATAGLQYAVEAGSVLTDSETCYAKYLARVEETGLFDSLFCEALSNALAVKLANAFTKSDAIVQKMAALADIAYRQATTVNCSEVGTVSVRKYSSLADARN